MGCVFYANCESTVLFSMLCLIDIKLSLQVSQRQLFAKAATPTRKTNTCDVRALNASCRVSMTMSFVSLYTCVQSDVHKSRTAFSCIVKSIEEKTNTRVVRGGGKRLAWAVFFFF